LIPAERLFPLVYEELRQMAQAKLKLEKAVDWLQATALVHGVSREAIAEMTGLTIHEVRIKWSYARAWLQVAIDSR
jgi:hypothetical protein